MSSEKSTLDICAGTTDIPTIVLEKKFYGNSNFLYSELKKDILSFIDKKQKVEWTANQDCYKISFFLRKS